MVHFSQLASITGGELLVFAEDLPIDTLCVDSRKATATPGTLFFAINGVRHDGHQYIADLHKIGVRQFVVERMIPGIDMLPGVNIIQVPSSVGALQQLAIYHRSQYSIPVVGITGSNGKTIIKEWLYQMLSKDRVVVKNPGSYNSQIGVPLSIWQIQPHHSIGVFEAGISRPGEMDRLNDIIRPTIGIFTNIGTAHDEGFRDVTEKINEKLKLFTNAEVVVYCRDHEAIHQNISQTGLSTFSWGTNPSATVKTSFQGTVCSLLHLGEEHRLLLPFEDIASRENCLHCVATLLYLGYPVTDIQQAVSWLRAVSMRLQLKDGINHCQLVDDTYNNDLGGLEISLHYLNHQHQKRDKRLIVSDILESGIEEEELVKRMAGLIAQNNVQHLVGIGPVLQRYRHLFPSSSAFYLTTDDFLQQFDFDSLHQEVILVKGARKYGFEKIVARLQQKVHGTIMEIDLNSMVSNLNFFKSQIRAPTKLMVMVKAFGYGSGSVEIANLLQYHKVDYLGVAYTDEGIELRKNNISIPVMVMNPSEESFDAIVAHSLEPEIYSFKIFQAFIRFLGGSPCRIHVKIDTGMHRLGFDPADLPMLTNQLLANTNIRVASIFSHLAAADEALHDAFSQKQFEKFVSGADTISKQLGYKPLYHILNSSGILRFPDMQMDMVRLGIGLYGINPTAEENALKPIASLKTLISQITSVRTGESIGYGRKGNVNADSRIATIAIGYADGYRRSLGNGVGEVLINGQRAKIIGNVCMDMTMIDVTGLDAVEGDEVILFGKGLPIYEVAAKANTIPYEILTNTSERVKRVFISDGI